MYSFPLPSANRTRAHGHGPYQYILGWGWKCKVSFGFFWPYRADQVAGAETRLETKEDIMIRTKTPRRPITLPDTYFTLWHPLRSIQSDAELDAAQAIIDDLLRQELDEGGMAYLGSHVPGAD